MLPMANHENYYGQQQAHDNQVVVVMVPFPLQGHLNQLLQLSRLVSSYDISVHYLSSSTHNRQAKARVHGWSAQGVRNIHFHDFKLPSFHSPPPNPDATIKFPTHLQPLFDASSSLREPVSTFLGILSSKSRRVVIIYDSLMASVVQDAGSISNAELYTFHSVSAFTIYCYLWEAMGRPLDLQAKIPQNLPSLKECFTLEFLNFIASQYEWTNLSSGKLYNTSKIIEASYLDLLANEAIGGTNKQWAIGPFNPVTVQLQDPKHRHKCLEWLDKQALNSVIYVSFGTTITLNDEQIKELAIGLEKSKQKFIWVLKEADKVDVFEQGEVRRAKLPKGYEERVKEMGIIVRDWAPQLAILGHSSTGGFLSHCGWNSCMESITMGVPIAAWPMHSDQPRNTVLITKVLKLGVVVKDWARRDELVTSITIAKAVRRLMASEEGDCMRKRAAELGGAVQQSMDKGGVSRSELDSFIAHITR